jgi:hypothetical protein
LNDYGINSAYLKSVSQSQISSIPEPISLIKRTKAKALEKSLKLPISPAFVNNFSLAQDPQI